MSGLELDGPTAELMRSTLQLAVPMWIDRIRDQAWTWAEIERRAAECSQAIAEKGDVLQFGGGRKGEAREAFNRFAEGLACAAFSPGGVKFLGLHFEATLASE